MYVYVYIYIYIIYIYITYYILHITYYIFYSIIFNLLYMIHYITVSNGYLCHPLPVPNVAFWPDRKIKKMQHPAAKASSKQSAVSLSLFCLSVCLSACLPACLPLSPEHSSPARSPSIRLGSADIYIYIYIYIYTHTLKIFQENSHLRNYPLQFLCERYHHQCACGPAVSNYFDKQTVFLFILRGAHVGTSDKNHVREFSFEAQLGKNTRVGVSH